MTDREIEDEIQARVNYKMAQLLSSVKTMANNNWHNGFKSGNAKFTNYWEAFTLMVNCFNKELKSPLPSDNMVEEFKNKHKGEVLGDIIEKIKTFGVLHAKEEGRIRRFLIKVIDKLQN